MAQRRAGEIHRIDVRDHGAGGVRHQRSERDFQVGAAGIGFPVAKHPQRETGAGGDGVADQMRQRLARNLDTPLAADTLQHRA